MSLLNVSDIRTPQFILAYPENYSNNPEKDVWLRVREGTLSNSNIIVSFTLLNLRDNNMVRVNLDKAVEIQGPPEIIGCGGEVEYNSRLRINKKLLNESEYEVILYNKKNQKSHKIHFIVRALDDVRTVGIMHPTFTWQAYNRENGGSFYWGKEYEEGKISISMNRPTATNPKYHSIYSVIPFISTLNNSNISFKSFCNMDLNNNPDLLKSIDVLILCAHDEYWTHSIRDSIDMFVKNGKHIASFGANIGWWAIHVDNNQLYINKTHVDDTSEFDRGTGQFRKKWINRPIQTLLGLSYQYAGYPVKRSSYEKYAKDKLSITEYDNSGDIIILEENHPIFDGLNFTKYSRWGNKQKVLDIEVDGASLENDKIAHFRMEGVTTEIIVLAKALVECSRGLIDTVGKYTSESTFEEVGIFSESSPFDKGGRVIYFGSIGYFNSINSNDDVGSRIFSNTINYLINGIGKKTPKKYVNYESDMFVPSKDSLPINISNHRTDKGVILSQTENGDFIIDSLNSNAELHTVFSTSMSGNMVADHNNLVIDVKWLVEENPEIITKLLLIFEYLDSEGVVIQKKSHPIRSSLIGRFIFSRIVEKITHADSIKLSLYQNKEQSSKIIIHNLSISNLNSHITFDL